MMAEKNRKMSRPLFKKYKNEVKACLLLAFPLAWWGVFFVYALVRAIYFSFTDLNMVVDQISTFNLDSYLRIFDFSRLLSDDPMVAYSFDKTFWKALGVSGIWTVGTLIGANVMGLLMSFLINKVKRGKKVFLALLFWPSLTSAVMSAKMTEMIFSSNASGLANTLLGMFGAESVDWFNSETYALFALMFLPVLLGFSTKMLIYYAAILGVPTELYEAARLDTKSDAKIFWYVTLPLIRNALMINMTMSLIEGLRVLGSMQLVTKGSGAPNNSTLSLMLYIYNMGFGQGTFSRAYMGRASAYSMVLFAIILILTVIQQKILGNKEEGSVHGA